MTDQPTPDPTPDPSSDIPGLDVTNLHAEDVPAFDAPDPSKSKDKPRFRRRAAGDKADDKPARKTARKPYTPPKRKGAFQQPLEQLYVGLGITLMPVDPICANAVIQSAEHCAQSLDELAYQNEAVRRMLYRLTTTSAVGVVIAAHVPIITAIAMHHVPAVQRVMGDMGAQMAENIAAQMQAQNGSAEGDTPPNE